jgi:hypothetical protein
VYGFGFEAAAAAAFVIDGAGRSDGRARGTGHHLILSFIFSFNSLLPSLFLFSLQVIGFLLGREEGNGDEMVMVESDFGFGLWYLNWYGLACCGL